MKWMIDKLESDRPYFQLRSYGEFLYFDYLEKDSLGWTLYLEGRVIGLLSQEQHDVVNYEEFAHEFKEK